MKKYFLCLGWVVALTQAFAQPAATPNPSNPSTPPTPVVTNSNLDADGFYAVLLAELARFEGKVGETFQIYLDTARKEPRDQLFERAARLALDARDGNTARQVALEWANKMPNSALAHNYVFQIMFGQGQYAAGIQPLKDYLRLTPDESRSGVILGLNSYFSRPADKLASASELQRLLAPYADKPTTGEASSMVLARALIHAERYVDALTELQKLTSQYPSSIDGWLLLGSLQLQENQFAGAQTALMQFLQIAQKTNLPSNNAAYAQAYLQLAQLAENRKDFEGAQNWLSKIEDEKERLAAQVRRASILAKQGKLEDARALIRELPEPTQAQARSKLLAEVQLLRDHKQVNAAIAMMDKALADAPKDTGLMYELSTLHDKAKSHDKMEALLRQIMVLEPNNQAAYNALGYSLADRGIRLPEAQKLIERALEITPNDPYIVDSLAWVFYRMGKLEEALKTLQGAYKTRADAEIGAHLGEVLWMMNRKDEARQAWRDARVINADNETLVETIKRLDPKF